MPPETPDPASSASIDDTLVGDVGTGPAHGPGRAGERAFERGDAIGRYVVLSRLGAGGMGVVYAAYDPELDRKVAIKLLLPDVVGSVSVSDGRSRLLREAQALARLTHPNVITVHDVGTVDGAVFVAMEFVDGATWTQWLEHERSWRDVIEVALAAGRGIAAAHAVGIVHRDFKPDNVMIGNDGRVRVLDFGLARPAGAGELDERDGATTHEDEKVSLSSSSFDARLTRTGALMGTPAYMAPEQHLGHAVDQRTDQFAFCVSVYEALYGERPFAGETFAALAFQVTQGKIREPPRTNRASKVPTWLRRELVRGLAARPEQRHPSMDALLRVLDRDPARTRRRVAFGLGTALVVAAAGATAQRLGDDPAPCADLRAQLAGVWDDTVAERVEQAFAASGASYAADAYAGVEREMSAYADAWVTSRTEACEATRVRGEQSDATLTTRNVCLDRRRQQIKSLVEIWLAADADAVERAVEAAESLSPIAPCDDVEGLALGVRPPDDPDLRERVRGLQQSLDAAAAMLRSGRPRPAEELVESVVEPVEATDYRPLQAELLLLRGQLETAPKQRVTLFEDAAFMAEAGRHDQVAAQAWIELIRAYSSDLNDFPAAERAVTRARAAVERVGNDEELQTRLFVVWGQFLNTAEQHERAVELLREARRRRVEAGQEGTPEALGELVTLSNALMDMGVDDEPGGLLEAAIPEATRTLGPGHPWVGKLWGTLARVQYHRDDNQDAVASLRRAIEIFDAAYGPDSRPAASCLNGLGLALEDLGQLEQAHAAYVHAADIMARELGEDHLNVVSIWGNVARLESHLGHHEQAIARLERVLARKREIYGTDNVEVAYTLDNLGEVQLAGDRAEQALHSYREAVRMLEDLEGPDSFRLAYSLTGVGQCLLALGQPRPALQQLERAMSLQRRHEASIGAPNRARTHFAYARALWEAAHEHAPARAQATLARDIYAADTPYYAPRRDEIDAWLAAHPE